MILISDCQTNKQRLEYIYELKKYIPVDIYGKCSTLKCPSGNVNCREYLSTRYKFFFAFENSLCSDYITEKFFDTLAYMTVPVVLGAGDYTYYAPKSAFINVLDYPKPKELAEYLIYLNANSTAYLEFFKWKKFIHKDLSMSDKNSYLCEICARAQLESFTGIRTELFLDHKNKMGMYENCMSMRSSVEATSGEKSFLFSRERSTLQMKYYGEE